jgi:hypothetical protein
MSASSSSTNMHGQQQPFMRKNVDKSSMLLACCPSSSSSESVDEEADDEEEEDEDHDIIDSDYDETDSEDYSDDDSDEASLLLEHVLYKEAAVTAAVPSTPAAPPSQPSSSIMIKHNTNCNNNKPAPPITGGATSAKVERPSSVVVNSVFKVPVAAKKPGAGIHISSVMRQFLTRNNHSDGDLAALSGRNQTIAKLLQRSDSAEKLGSHHDDQQSRMIFVHQDKNKPAAADVVDDVDTEPLQRPKDLLQEILQANGCTNTQPRSYKPLTEAYFMRVTPSMIAAYDMTLMTAVRTNDLETIQQLYKAGKMLQCCNRFHESILHAAARRGSTEVMHFLLHTAKLNLKVVCDSGRTPLHDACWTGSPNFNVIRMILEQCPEFMIIADNRNFTPMDYIPREAWKEWCVFMKEHPSLITPRK